MDAIEAAFYVVDGLAATSDLPPLQVASVAFDRYKFRMQRILLSCVLLLLLAMSSCRKEEEVVTRTEAPAQPPAQAQTESSNQPETTMAKTYAAPADQKIDANKKYTATIE